MTPKLNENQIEFLAWSLMAELLSLVKEEVVVGDLHPGDGQYDCLSLIARNPNPFLMLNRNGTSAISGDVIVEDIWLRAARLGTRETALHIISAAAIEIDETIRNSRKEIIETCKRIAFWVRTKSEKNGRAICCWVDGVYGAGPDGTLMSQVKIPKSWQLLDPPYSSSDWSAWIYALTIEEKVIGLVNMLTGEAINPDGSIWQEFAAKRPVLPKLFPSNAWHVSLPDIEINPIAKDYFKKISNFNGYEILGEELIPIANAIAEEWTSSGAITGELEQIKGALFVAWRTSHFTDGYPSDSDLDFIKALSDAIDAAEKLIER